MEKKMNMTALNTSDDIRIISDEDLGAVAGGSNPVLRLDGGGGGHGTGRGSGGHVVGGNFGNQTGIGVAGFIIAAGVAILLSL